MEKVDASPKKGDLTEICFRTGAGNRHQKQADLTAPKGVPLEERRKEMRNRHKGHGRHARDLRLSQSCINANTVNITNVTNVVQVAKIGTSGGHHGWHKHGKRNRGNGDRGMRDRKPRLLRYCGSCGLLDHDVAEGMSERELCDGFVDVGSYAARGLGRTASKWAGDMGRHARGFFGSLFGIVEHYLS